MNVDESLALLAASPAGSVAGWRGLVGQTVGRHLEGLAAQVGVGVAAGLLFAWLAPFDTDRADPITRIGFWIIVLTAWFPTSAVVRLIVEHTPVRRLPPRVRIAVRFIAPIPPMMFVCALMTKSVFHWYGSVGEIAELFLQVAVVGYALEAVGSLVRPGPQADQPAQPASVQVPADPGSTHADAASGSASHNAPEMPPRLLERIPHAVRSEILCLQMEDHYVRVHTRRGSCLVLMRLSDAIEELDGMPGLKVHRSWWVARSAFGDVDRTTRAIRLRLANGRIVPVSRPHLEAVTALEATLSGRETAEAA